MKKILFPGFFILLMAGIVSCKPPSEGDKTNTMMSADNSQTSLDWAGSYRGVLPCADCEGIQTVILLNKDNSYTIQTKYLGKSDSMMEHTGKISWNEQGNTIALDGSGNPDLADRYQVGENSLTRLDKDGKKIIGELEDKYVLSKGDYSILEKYWKLTELNGKPVVMDSTFPKEPHIIFKEKDNRLIGNGGCNNISGTYELKPNNRITISNAITTRMACQNVDLESQFLTVLQTADNYNIMGDTLVLNKARMAPLARFMAVYLK
jgi:copper homeostasis protein (lipoprotein)